MTVDITPVIFIALIGLVLILVVILGMGNRKTFRIPLLNIPFPVPTKFWQKSVLFSIGTVLLLIGLAPGIWPVLFPSAKDLAPIDQIALVTPTAIAVMSETQMPQVIPSSTLSAVFATMASVITATSSIQPSSTPLGGSDLIALVSRLEGENHIYFYSISRGQRTRLPNTKGANGGIAWSTDGAGLAFTADKGEGKQIYIVTRDGVNIEKITSGSELNSNPTWSPDGDQIAYESSAGLSDIFVYNLNARTIYHAVDEKSDSVNADWSPDGQSLVFVTWLTGSADIYKLDLSTGLQTLLIATGVPETKPRWSPSGEHLAYTEGQPDGSFGIAVYDLLQNKVVLRIVEPGIILDTAGWSPDGKWLVMTCQYPGGPQSREICRYDVSNHKLYRMTNDRVYDDWPDWAP